MIVCNKQCACYIDTKLKLFRRKWFRLSVLEILDDMVSISIEAFLEI